MSKIGALLFHLRGFFWAVVCVLFLLFADPTLPSILLGLPLVLLGQAYRIWAAGCIRRYRGERVGAEKLTTWGPYALSRNPLYFGNFIMGLGFALMMNLWWFFLVFYVLFFAGMYGVIIAHEERFLASKFGADFQTYCAQVNRFWPSLKGWNNVTAGPYDRWIVAQSEIYTLIQTVVLCGLIFALLWSRS